MIQLQSKLFSKTSKEAPKDEPSINARLLEQAGFIQKVTAGVYTFMPLGTRVLRNIEQIVREEMDTVGAEMLMPGLQPKANWQATAAGKAWTCSSSSSRSRIQTTRWVQRTKKL